MRAVKKCSNCNKPMPRLAEPGYGPGKVVCKSCASAGMKDSGIVRMWAIFTECEHGGDLAMYSIDLELSGAVQITGELAEDETCEFRFTVQNEARFRERFAGTVSADFATFRRRTSQ